MHEYTLIWLFLALILVITELSSPGLLFFLSFAAGALAAASASSLNHSLFCQLLVFLIWSSSMFVPLRSWVRKQALQQDFKTNTDALIGKQAIVVEPLGGIAEPGRVKINGQLWLARELHNEKVDVGQIVEIQAIAGCHVTVRRQEQKYT